MFKYSSIKFVKTFRVLDNNKSTKVVSKYLCKIYVPLFFKYCNFEYFSFLNTLSKNA